MIIEMMVSMIGAIVMTTGIIILSCSSIGVCSTSLFLPGWLVLGISSS